MCMCTYHTDAHTHVATSHVLVHMLQMCVHTHMTTHDTSPPISTTHMCKHIHKTTAHTHDSQQSIWRQLPDVPYCRSSVCVGDGVLLAIGGAEEDNYGSKKTSSIYGLHVVNTTDTTDALHHHRTHIFPAMPSSCTQTQCYAVTGGLHHHYK